MSFRSAPRSSSVPGALEEDDIRATPLESDMALEDIRLGAGNTPALTLPPSAMGSHLSAAGPYSFSPRAVATAADRRSSTSEHFSPTHADRYASKSANMNPSRSEESIDDLREIPLDDVVAPSSPKSSLPRSPFVARYDAETRSVRSGSGLGDRRSSCPRLAFSSDAIDMADVLLPPTFLRHGNCVGRTQPVSRFVTVALVSSLVLFLGFLIAALASGVVWFVVVAFSIFLLAAAALPGYFFRDPRFLGYEIVITGAPTAVSRSSIDLGASLDVLVYRVCGSQMTHMSMAVRDIRSITVVNDNVIRVAADVLYAQGTTLKLEVRREEAFIGRVEGCDTDGLYRDAEAWLGLIRACGNPFVTAVSKDTACCIAMK